MEDLADRLIRYTRRDGECIRWIGTISKQYGYLRVAGKDVLVHRLAYEMFVGRIPTGLHIDHTCNHTWCIKPEHLEPVTQAENNRRQAERRRKGVDNGTE